jgi:hypothetical protein
LAVDVLDPVVERFGVVSITYGFGSLALIRHIHRRIDPLRDQHAGHELRPDGTPICPRLGQAVDFRIDGASSASVARWVATCLPFDRLYFYGADRPIHVSIGPQNSRAIVEMITGASGRRVPQRRSLSSFADRHGTSS